MFCKNCKKPIEPFAGEERNLTLSVRLIERNKAAIFCSMDCTFEVLLEELPEDFWEYEGV
jgi:hypothetical protein